MYSKTKFKGYTHTQTRNFFFVRSVLETRFARITTTVPLLLLNNYCGTLGTKVSSYSQMYTTTKRITTYSAIDWLGSIAKQNSAKDEVYFRVKISAPFSGAKVNLLDEGTSSKLAVIMARLSHRRPDSLGQNPSSLVRTQTKKHFKISAPFSGATVNLLDEGTSSKLAVIWPGSVTVGQTP